MSRTLIDRYHCHYEQLEEYKNGLWRRRSGASRRAAISEARRFMMDTGRFSEAMSRVCTEWENSCKVNFTTPSVNPIAWLGQAAVCIETSVPEECTRAAWSELPFEVQQIANSHARRHLNEWRRKIIDQGDLFSGA